MLVVIPSAREVRLDYLQPLIAHGCRFVVVDDSPGRIQIDHPQFSVYNWGHQTRDLGPLAAAIPRGNGACRDYGFVIAWREADAGEVIVALDDDCLITDPEWPRLAEAALDDGSRPVVATSARHWNVLDLYDNAPDHLFPRGFPYASRVGYERAALGATRATKPLFHLGLWQGVFDVNAIDKLEGPAFVHPEARLRVTSALVPKGTLVSACSMNMIFRRELIPAVYQLPMAVDVMPGWRIDRYGDIWGGFITKLLMDTRGDAFSVGAPMITHLKEGNALRNTWQEHVCHVVNEEFIELLAAADLGHDADASSYLELFARLPEHFARAKGSPLLKGYLGHLAGCMDAWVRALARPS